MRGPQYVASTVSDCTPATPLRDVLDHSVRTVEDAAAVSASDAVTPTPWFAEFRDALHRVTQFSEHEMTHQPALLVVAVTTATPNPGARLRELASSDNLPLAFRRVRSALLPLLERAA